MTANVAFLFTELKSERLAARFEDIGVLALTLAIECHLVWSRRLSVVTGPQQLNKSYLQSGFQSIYLQKTESCSIKNFFRGSGKFFIFLSERYINLLCSFSLKFSPNQNMVWNTVEKLLNIESLKQSHYLDTGVNRW